jgi:hypothetical protein
VNASEQRPVDKGSERKAEHPRRLSAVELTITLVITGAVVMVVEILGTRIIGPVFGVSLFVWTGLLAVTLTSLAIGYYAGGVVVDRKPNPRVLGWAVVAAGALIGLVPILTRAVLASVSDLGLRLGPLVAALLLFGPALAVLGMVGPIAVRLATTDVRLTGHRVGHVYAVSTGGSLAGTLLTAFILIPSSETETILIGSAVLLIVLGAALLVSRGASKAPLALLLPIAASFAPRAPVPPGIKILDRAQSPYGLIEVIEAPERGVRVLRAEHSLIGAQFIRDQSPAFGFIHVLESLRFLRPAARDMLVVGLGVGLLPTTLSRFGVRSDVVEIDPAVVAFAEKYFGFRPTGEVHVEDARAFLRTPRHKYDLIVHDTFTGGASPDHLLSLEVVNDIRKALQPDGALALNFVGYQHGPHVEASWLIARTLRAAFKNVRVFRDRPQETKPDIAVNLIFVASDGNLAFNIPPRAEFHNEECERIARSFQNWEILKEVPPGAVVTDARNPLSRLQLAAAEEHFEAMQTILPRELWLPH